MRPLLYDLKRAFLSRGVLAVMLFMIVFSLAIIPLIESATGTGGSTSNNINASAYDAPDGYHVLFYVYNEFGQPLSGVELNLTFSPPNIGASKIIATNSSGFATAVIPYPSAGANRSYLLGYSVSENGGFTESFLSLNPEPHGEPYPSASVGIVTNPNNSAKRDLIIFAVGPNFTKEEYSVYYKLLPQGVPSVNSNESGMTFLTNITQIANLMSVPILSNVSQSEAVQVDVFDTNGSNVYQFIAPVQAFLPQQVSVSANSIASSFLIGILGFFVPLMAILGAYSVYGRDRVTGILESVLVRPVTRRGVLASRYIAATVGVSLATLVTVVFVDALIWIETKQTLTLGFVLTSAGTLAVEVAAFVALMFIISQFTRSTGSLIGAGIGLFLVLDFLWSLLLLLVINATGVSFSSVPALHLQVDLTFLNPAQFLNLVQILQTNTVNLVPVQAAQYGVTDLSVVITGVLWVVLPVLVALGIVSRRD